MGAGDCQGYEYKENLYIFNTFSPHVSAFLTFHFMLFYKLTKIKISSLSLSLSLSLLLTVSTDHRHPITTLCTMAVPHHHTVVHNHLGCTHQWAVTSTLDHLMVASVPPVHPTVFLLTHHHQLICPRTVRKITMLWTHQVVPHLYLLHLEMVRVFSFSSW